MKTCAGCGQFFTRPRNGKGVAWWRARRYCTVECYQRRQPAALSDRFWRYVRQGEGCWEWTAARGGSGYGTFGINRRRMMPAHRFSWELHFGPIPDGLFVCHHCDNRLCVRPDHLFLGTPRANTRDMDRKGRRVVRPNPGVRNGNAKLTDDQVREIRFRRDAGAQPIALADEFGVTATLISRIALRKAWRHVE